MDLLKKNRKLLRSAFLQSINGNQISGEFLWPGLHEQSDARQKPLQRFCRAIHVVESEIKGRPPSIAIVGHRYAEKTGRPRQGIVAYSDR